MCKVLLPKNAEDSSLEFENKERVSIFVYANIECMLKPVKNNDQVLQEY